MNTYVAMQAGLEGTELASFSKQVQRAHPRLLRELQPQSPCWAYNLGVAPPAAQAGGSLWVLTSRPSRNLLAGYLRAYNQRQLNKRRHILCGKIANLKHVLSCRSNLIDGKFPWKHDQVLTKLAAGLEQARTSRGSQFMKFLRAGETVETQARARGILATANDWEMQIDLRRQLKFPEKVTATSFRPDIVLWSF